jgi:hypothetical protein
MEQQRMQNEAGFADHLLSTSWVPDDYRPSIPAPAGIPWEEWRATCFSTEVVFAAEMEKLEKASQRRRAQTPCEKRRGIVYFIGGRTGPIKIGFTTKVEERLQRLSSNSPVPLRVLASFTGSMADEGRLHDLFQASRIHGEWFQRSPDILAEIAKLGHSS